ncbi:Uncharacterized protein OS=Blastopirellula marina DSM 3645 GN=DSM3645_20907 PE=4 SV=1 [Gemmataceae bacterium]|nr:Uncharacterized protein OS=Blastopirellula marina DSM 3645 GN=DSM3645_20907 PE=4 SV=1 [Gemmataceae bacterium]VTT96835.1 Uncharacterized protein OS=Blastopirellula marina DSM 3645 GN=DSM3645_20907 PE=4 SV=1 [Gemmataceae bacterium]
MTLRRAFVAAVLAALPVGCGNPTTGGPSAEVTGSVTLDGKPLADAEVQFVPKGNAALGLHTAKTDAAGRFRITRDAPNNPVKPGTYAVLVSKVSGGNDPSKPGGGMDAQKNEVPAAYQDRNRTPLTAEVRDGATDLPPFAISHAAPAQ